MSSTYHHHRHRRAQTVVECKSTLQTDIQNSNPYEIQIHRDTPSLMPSRATQSISSTLPPLSTATNLPQKPQTQIDTKHRTDTYKARDTPLSLCNESRHPSLPIFADTITMSLSGVSLSYSLGAITSDPSEVIELLKATSSERGNWIHVAAHYRRKSNPRAALSVVEAMLKGVYCYSSLLVPIPVNLFLTVMVEQKVPEQDLKPAYLLLSGCETDLAKESRKEGRNSDSTEHYKNASTWLQKVYGTFDCSLSTGTATPSAPHPVRALPDPKTPPPPTQSQNHGHDRILQREIQSLRDRLEHQRDLLADVRASKRKLEDDFEMERNYRRRLERHIEDLRREREGTRDLNYYGHGGYN
ncbi:hypothetical protein V5O48_006906 [Marasmius crinis-equi]|uniref:Uncharacterized protein n=1 Tax=Marasmius crinis-equi TaxID=585013 RepID=A0ABR3FIZ1_9AGAR